jgi:DNA-binding response OmpR family regulator
MGTSGGATLLVVDDERELGDAVTQIFARRGYRVIGASDGNEALERVAHERPDLILLDLHLPKLDGWQVCRRLKQDPATADIPIIMMTAANPTMAEAQEGLELGADEYVAKPFLREVLIHNVERLLGREGDSDCNLSDLSNPG